MRIQKNHTPITFRSNEGLKRICEETLVEFHQEFPRLKSPTKLWQDAQNAGCETKKNLFEDLARIWNEKYKTVKTEYINFEVNNHPSYEEKMGKIKELMKESGVSNCGLMNRYYQYMLAKKGVYSECSVIKVYDHLPLSLKEKPIKDHFVLTVKDSQSATSSINADAWLNHVEDSNKFWRHVKEYMRLNSKNRYVYEDTPFLIGGYRNFLAETQMKNQNITARELRPLPASTVHQTR